MLRRRSLHFCFALGAMSPAMEAALQPQAQAQQQPPPPQDQDAEEQQQQQQKLRYEYFNKRRLLERLKEKELAKQEQQQQQAGNATTTRLSDMAGSGVPFSVLHADFTKTVANYIALQSASLAALQAVYKQRDSRFYRAKQLELIAELPLPHEIGSNHSGNNKAAEFPATCTIVPPLALLKSKQEDSSNNNTSDFSLLERIMPGPNRIATHGGLHICGPDLVFDRDSNELLTQMLLSRGHGPLPMWWMSALGTAPPDSGSSLSGGSLSCAERRMMLPSSIVQEQGVGPVLVPHPAVRLLRMVPIAGENSSGSNINHGSYINCSASISTSMFPVLYHHEQLVTAVPTMQLHRREVEALASVAQRMQGTTSVLKRFAREYSSLVQAFAIDAAASSSASHFFHSNNKNNTKNTSVENKSPPQQIGNYLRAASRGDLPPSMLQHYVLLKFGRKFNRHAVFTTDPETARILSEKTRVGVRELELFDKKKQTNDNNNHHTPAAAANQLFRLNVSVEGAFALEDRDCSRHEKPRVDISSAAAEYSSASAVSSDNGLDDHPLPLFLTPEGGNAGKQESTGDRLPRDFIRHAVWEVKISSNNNNEKPASPPHVVPGTIFDWAPLSAHLLEQQWSLESGVTEAQSIINQSAEHEERDNDSKQSKMSKNGSNNNVTLWVRRIRMTRNSAQHDQLVAAMLRARGSPFPVSEFRAACFNRDKSSFERNPMFEMRQPAAGNNNNSSGSKNKFQSLEDEVEKLRVRAGLNNYRDKHFNNNSNRMSSRRGAGGRDEADDGTAGAATSVDPDKQVVTVTSASLPDNGAARVYQHRTFSGATVHVSLSRQLEIATQARRRRILEEQQKKQQKQDIENGEDQTATQTTQLTSWDCRVWWPCRSLKGHGRRLRPGAELVQFMLSKGPNDVVSVSYANDADVEETSSVAAARLV